MALTLQPASSRSRPVTCNLSSDMLYFKITDSNEDQALKKAVETIRDGGIIAFPTETFYGLGADCMNEEALLRLYDLKKRPPEKAMPVIVGSIEDIDLITTDIPDEALILMEKYWPGPLTIVLNARKGLSICLTGGREKVAVRVPGRSIALSLAVAAGIPITATSANPSGMPPAEKAEEVLKFFGDEIDLILDGGQTPGGSPSTIVEIINGRIKVLREGKIAIS